MELSTSWIIPCSADDLRVYEPQIDVIRKGIYLPGTPTITGYDTYFAAAEGEIATDLLNRTPPIYLDRIPIPRQLTPLKVFKTLSNLYRAGIKVEKDRHSTMATIYEDKYGAALRALQIQMADGGRVPAKRNRLIRQ